MERYAYSHCAYDVNSDEVQRIFRYTGRNCVDFIVIGATTHEAVTLFRDILGPHRVQLMEIPCTGSSLVRSTSLSYVELRYRSNKRYVQN